MFFITFLTNEFITIFKKYNMNQSRKKECELLIKASFYVKIKKCVSRINDRGCSNTGEESPGFIGQDAG